MSCRRWFCCCCCCRSTTAKHSTAQVDLDRTATSHHYPTKSANALPEKNKKKWQKANPTPKHTQSSQSKTAAPLVAPEKLISAMPLERLYRSASTPTRKTKVYVG